LAAIAVVSPGQAQTTLLYEDFDSDWSTTNPPTGWRIYRTGDTSTNDWHRKADSTEPWPDNPTPYACLLNTPQEVGTDSLVSPVINCEDYNYIVLRCSTRVRNTPNPHYTRLLGSVGGGPFEHEIRAYQGVNYTQYETFDISSWAGNQSEVRLCWRFGGDNLLISYWCVDGVSVTGDIATSDVGVDSIFAPRDTVDSGAVVIPEVLVRNFKPEPVADSFKVQMRIGVFYRESTWVRETIPGNSTVRLSFPAWNVKERGRHPVSAQTYLEGDVNPDNNAKATSVFVEVRDVGVHNIVSPADTVDSAVVIQPQVEIKNYGNAGADSFRVHFTIGSRTYAPELVTELGSGGIQAVSFGDWYPNISGIVMARCSVYWYDDINPRNDTLSKRVFVKGSSLRNASAVGILVPSGAVRESTFVSPQGRARNLGSLEETFDAFFEIRNSQDSVVYTADTSLTVPAGQEDTASFADWLPTPEGNYTAKFYVALEGDQDPSNDTAPPVSFQVMGQIHDVACKEIITPVSRVEYLSTITPSAEVENPGDFPEGFWTLFTIYRGVRETYRDSARVENLAVGASQVLTFPNWTATQVGQYTARCSTMLDGDANLANNLKIAPFPVESTPFERRWDEMTPYPQGAKGLGKGAGLAYIAGVDGEYIYGTRGYKIHDFYRYNMATNEWELKAPVPGGERELYKGGCLEGDRHRYVYCVRGNKTLDFLRYDCAADSWTRLDDIPLGPDEREVKQGSDLEPVWIRDDLYMYLLKGDRLEFYRYNTTSNLWEQRADLPPGAKPRVYRGSFIVWDGDNTIYFFKAKYNETWAYNISEDAWSQEQLAGMPFQGMMGRKKKIKDGAAGCWYEGKIICMKGGNTQECWEFDPAGNSWFELETIPAYGSTGRKKRVKYGGDMQTPGNGRFYVTKGNKTLEFWRYSYAPGTGIRSREAPEPKTLEPGRMMVMPNPARGRVNLALPGIGAAVITVYDIHGALLGTTTTSSGRASLDLQGMSPGVYFIHADYGSGTETTKLIVE